MKTVNKLWYDSDRIFIEYFNGEIRSQSLRFFPRLRKATNCERETWAESHFGIHWENIDEDISFESFNWDDNDTNTLYHNV